MKNLARHVGCLLLFGGLLVAGDDANAACNNPSGATGSLNFNSTNDSFEFCNSADAWTAAGLTLGGPVSMTGTSIEFTDLPTTAQRITVMLLNYSTNGSSQSGIQLGAGSYETTGYVGVVGATTNGDVSRYSTNTALFPTSYGNSASGSYLTTIILTHGGDNLWTARGTGYASNPHVSYFNGQKSLSGRLDRIRITTAGGTDVFDAGTLSVLVE